MSDIKVGDFAVVVHYPCCGIHLGVILKVEKFTHTGAGYRCIKCGVKHNLEYVPSAYMPSKVTPGRHFPIAWLRRIPPLAEPETTEHRETVKA